MTNSRGAAPFCRGRLAIDAPPHGFDNPLAARNNRRKRWLVESRDADLRPLRRYAHDAGYHGLVLAAAISGVTGWLQPGAPATERASVAGIALLLPDKPSIAVLPFDNLCDGSKAATFRRWLHRVRERQAKPDAPRLTAFAAATGAPRVFGLMTLLKTGCRGPGWRR